ncbi:MAG TPA: ABC transporter ATP-binding protein [Lachnospiraceae bacterium]|nr:ABC transporter ATP-binding protein [Lachnospiraceae bacterium]
MVLAENLVKKYGEFSLHISMEIPDGRVTGLVGRNGAGKSTVIKLILGLIKADSGSLTVFGKEAGSLNGYEKEQIGVALSDSGFSTYLSVEDIIRILKKMYRNFDEDKFRKDCRNFGIPLDKRLKEFSTGMKAKVRVLVVLSHKAKLLIMDEPTAGLDVEARNEILDMLRSYLAENEERSILLTSHISSDLEGLCDDVYLIHNGKIILHEDTDTIMDQYAVIKVDKQLYDKVDKRYLISTRKESYGYVCFTSEKQYYIDNYPGIVVEKGGIDDLILMLTGGKR